MRFTRARISDGAPAWQPPTFDVSKGLTVELTDVVIIGAGPHGLAAAAHLRRAGVECRVFGDPLSFWRTMPAGMLLRSNWTARSKMPCGTPSAMTSSGIFSNFVLTCS